jgi:hypothetical protein
MAKFFEQVLYTNANSQTHITIIIWHIVQFTVSCYLLLNLWSKWYSSLYQIIFS